jgi:hypothetical protein
MPKVSEQEAVAIFLRKRDKGVCAKEVAAQFNLKPSGVKRIW